MDGGLDLEIRPLRRVEYDLLGQMGCFGDDDTAPIELLEGQLVAREKQGDRHATVQRRLVRQAVEAVPASEAEIGAANPIAATDTSEPEPDVALFPPGTYRGEHPRSATLLIEVSDSSLRKDLILKARIYAQAGIPEYWVVDLVHDQVVVHRQPTDQGYAEVARHRSGILRPTRHPQLAVDLGALFA